jgi:hypothetical protein
MCTAGTNRGRLSDVNASLCMPCCNNMLCQQGNVRCVPHCCMPAVHVHSALHSAQVPFARHMHPLLQNDLAAHCSCPIPVTPFRNHCLAKPVATPVSPARHKNNVSSSQNTASTAGRTRLHHTPLRKPVQASTGSSPAPWYRATINGHGGMLIAQVIVAPL